MLFGKKKRQIVRLLVVEDEPLVAFDAEHALIEADYEIVAVVDRVVEALAVLAGEQAIDLVLADINLADGSGLEVARAARRRGVPVLFVTGSFPEEGVTLAAGCLTKPYASRDLLAAIGAVEAGLAGKPPKRLPPGLRLFPQPA